MALVPLLREARLLRSLTRTQQYANQSRRGIKTTSDCHSDAIQPEDKADLAKELAIRRPTQIFAKEFPDFYNDGKFVSRMSYVEFIDEALAKLKNLGLEKDLNAYKELLRVFPPGKFWPRRWDSNFGLFNAPQQLAAVRVLHQMELNGLRPDKDFEKIIIDAFSKKSDVWVKVIRMNFWSMKGRNIDPNPLPEKLPEEAHQKAKVALSRMLEDPKSIITITNSSRVPQSVDKTWIVFSQSPDQKVIIDRLPEESILYVEEGGEVYVGKDYLTYYLLKYRVDDETRERKTRRTVVPNFDYNTLKVKFYGKPIKEVLADMLDKHFVDSGYVLGLCITGTSSQDSLLSWIKILQERNPLMNKHNVIFQMRRRVPELIEYQDKMRQTDRDNEHQARDSSHS